MWGRWDLPWGGGGREGPSHTQKEVEYGEKSMEEGEGRNGWEGEEGDVGEGAGEEKGGEEWRDGWGRDWVGEKTSWRVWSKVEYILCEV